ncbi:MAG: tryptophan synthase subunit alpha [Deltaproteobacteria bacterium]|nr:tryptophan synthase subunit alpha [Deltaproteobacteria bacterium]
MNRIDEKFAALRAQGKAALIPFVSAGDPNIRTTLQILGALEQGGADLIELGVPFSDPIADGPTIQRASERSLKQGCTLPRVLALARDFRRGSELPLILFGYYNPFFHYGLERFAKRAREAGVDGVLCVDLPPEESGELKYWTDAVGLDTIFLLAPTSEAERIRTVAQRCQGFIYYVSVIGITGARARVEAQLEKQVAGLRRYTSLPIGVGFGISSPEQAASVASFADAVVVGSALIEAMEKRVRTRDKIKQAGEFAGRLKRAMDGVSKRTGG